MSDPVSSTIDPRILVERKLGELANKALRTVQDEMRERDWPVDLRVAMWRKIAQRATSFAESAERRKTSTEV